VPARIYHGFCRLVGARFSPYRTHWHQAIRLAQEYYLTDLEAEASQHDNFAFEFIIEYVIPDALVAVPEDVREELKEISGLFLSWIAEDRTLNDRYRRYWVSLADDILWHSARSQELLDQFRRYVEKSFELNENALQNLDPSHSGDSTDRSGDSGILSIHYNGRQPHSARIPSRLSGVVTMSYTSVDAHKSTEEPERGR
jgi:hypothetical protein